MSKKKLVLYQPQQVDASIGPPCSGDMLPLEMLTISAFPLAEGYDIVIVDGSLYSQEEAHRRVVEACEGALLYATTGILGFMVTDGFACSTKVKARFPKLPSIIGGWFASVRPDLQLATGLYDAVVLGQGELAFLDVVQAIEAGTSLEGIEGLALWRDNAVFKTPKRSVVGWDNVLNVPWHLLDIEPYREMQLRADSHRQILRMPTPLAMGSRKPYFGITYFSSYGCPEPCTFCCSPFVTDRRWKAIPADRMLDELSELKERWNFDVVRFHDANFGVMEKRSRDFANDDEAVKHAFAVQKRCIELVGADVHVRARLEPRTGVQRVCGVEDDPCEGFAHARIEAMMIASGRARRAGKLVREDR